MRIDTTEILLGGEVSFAKDWSDRFKKIRDFYEYAMPKIMSSPKNQWAIDPYAVDWVRVFSPIEFLIWQDIRQAGAVLYPQLPVGRFFVDFGHPVAKVCIECDGKRYHQDKEKDALRESELIAMGWSVFRITGRDCYEDSIEGIDGQEYQISVGQELVKRVSEGWGLK